MQGHRPAKNLQFRLGALRALETASRLITGAADVNTIDLHCFNRAAQLVKGHWSSSAAYRVGGQLEAVASFLSENRLTKAPVKWTNPIPRPTDGERVGEEADRRRQEKLPSPAALDAVAKAFQIATDPGDQVVAAIAALLCSAPDRINEVLTLPVDCEVRTQHRGEPAYGLRWWPSKGAEPMVKWIMPGMVDIVAAAIDKIRRHTESARRVAAWYEANPTKLWLPDDLEHLRGTHLNTGQLSACLALPRASALAWIKGRKVPFQKRDRDISVAFSDLERAAVTDVPNHFPVMDTRTGLHFKDALCVVHKNFFASEKPQLDWMIEAINQGQVGDRLGRRVKFKFPSMFTRLNLTEEDGTPISINTHAFRHYLNTMAQSGGLSQLDIAKWSGRKDIRQNAAYDHVSATALLTRVKGLVGGEDEFFGALEPVRPNTPSLRAEFARLAVKTAHTTDFGFCVHDFVMAPCELLNDCLNCNEHVCIKGDRDKTAAIRHRLYEARGLLAKTATAASEGRRGANRWEDHHRATVARLEQLLDVLDDPAVPAGSLVRIGVADQASRVTMAEAANTLSIPPAALQMPDFTPEPDGLDDLMKEWEDTDA